jgi:hypothetical protein
MHVIKINRHHGPIRCVASSALNAYKMCRHAAVWPLQCSARLLITHDVSLQCIVTRQHSTTESLLC